MAVFCFKKITSSSLRLGEIFKAARIEKGFSLNEAEKLTRIPEKFLSFLEQGSFERLPQARGYRLAYVKVYAEFLGLNADDATNRFTREQGLKNAVMVHPLKKMKYFPFSSVGIFLRNSVAIGVVLIFAGYLTWQIRGIMQPPSLIVYTPTEGTVVNNPTTVVEGITETESQLAVNGQGVITTSDGKFQAELNLMPGLNTITISSTKKKHGKTTTITRHIIVRSSPKNKGVSLIDGTEIPTTNKTY